MKTHVKVLIITILLTTIHTTIGKYTAKSENVLKLAGTVKSHGKPLHRLLRPMEDEDDKTFQAIRGKRSPDGSNADVYFANEDLQFPSAAEGNIKSVDNNFKNKDPFWSNRGRRGSGKVDQLKLPSGGKRRVMYENIIPEKLQPGQMICIDAGYLGGGIFVPDKERTLKSRREGEGNPFWGNRGRRSENKIEQSPFWVNRGRQDDGGPLWASRGRREEYSGGQRDDDFLFWGARGRRMQDEEESPFWTARGRRYENGPVTNSRGAEDLQDFIKSIKAALSSGTRSKSQGFWHDRGIANSLERMTDDKGREKSAPGNSNSNSRVGEVSAMRSLRQDTLYAEQPHYILVDRSSRSVSAEDDPYFISRGKKRFTSQELSQATRGRRGTLEQLAKTAAQVDPFFISRGKKENSSYDQLTRAKEMMCSAILQMDSKYRAKRDSDSDRNRRNILKKLALQLQSDPYFVSRGKKNIEMDDGIKFSDFAERVREFCQKKYGLKLSDR